MKFQKHFEVLNTIGFCSFVFNPQKDKRPNVRTSKQKGGKRSFTIELYHNDSRQGFEYEQNSLSERTQSEAGL